MTPDSPYVLVTAARNEAEYIGQTIEAVNQQTVRPLRWVIASDGSTDHTASIVKDYARRDDYIELLEFAPRRTGCFHSQYKAISAAYQRLQSLNFSFIGKLDGDISFDGNPGYFETLIRHMERHPRTAITGGWICEQRNGTFESRPSNSPRSVPGGIQFIRRACFEAVGGYAPLKYGGSDWLAEIQVRQRGWEVQAVHELRVLHHRITSSAGGLLAGCLRQGLKAASFGSYAPFELMGCLRRAAHAPILLGGMLRCIGFLWGTYVRHECVIPLDAAEFLRKEQARRLRLFFRRNAEWNA